MVLDYLFTDFDVLFIILEKKNATADEHYITGR